MRNVTDELYETILRRDSRFDGVCYIGIKSTGIVCFPSCRSRTPKRENVRVFDTLEDAVRAGFRPCKRCKPDNPSRQAPEAEVVSQVLELLRDRYHEPITLTTIANAIKVSPYHLQRTFKRATGYSPAQQLQTIRMEAAERMLRSTSKPIVEIAMDVGFRNASHFSAAFHKRLGKSPAEFRRDAR